MSVVCLPAEPPCVRRATPSQCHRKRATALLMNVLFLMKKKTHALFPSVWITLSCLLYWSSSSVSVGLVLPCPVFLVWIILVCRCPLSLKVLDVLYYCFLCGSPSCISFTLSPSPLCCQKCTHIKVTFRSYSRDGGVRVLPYILWGRCPSLLPRCHTLKSV